MSIISKFIKDTLNFINNTPELEAVNPTIGYILNLKNNIDSVFDSTRLIFINENPKIRERNNTEIPAKEIYTDNLKLKIFNNRKIRKIEIDKDLFLSLIKDQLSDTNYEQYKYILYNIKHTDLFIDMHTSPDYNDKDFISLKGILLKTCIKDGIFSQANLISCIQYMCTNPEKI